MIPRAAMLLLLALAGPARGAAAAPEEGEARQTLLEQIQRVHRLDASQALRVRAVLDGSRVIGQGNPAISVHPMSPEQCNAIEAQQAAPLANPRFEEICGAPYMAPLHDPRRQRPEEARACIDQLEFPDIPCAYPVVWVRVREAAQICEAMGKRLCDAHEWEGACAGALEEPDYRFDLARGVPAAEGVARMRAAHNRAHDPGRAVSGQPATPPGVCATGSGKSTGCPGADYARCGSNTYPTGAFPDCKSALGVYDLHGNVAEEMNLPLAADQMASRGSERLGVTEMKGSWFVFDRFRAHPDWCRWRAPYWHGTKVRALDSHANYHLGFRCCKTLAAPPATPPTPPPAGSPPRR